MRLNKMHDCPSHWQTNRQQLQPIPEKPATFLRPWPPPDRRCTDFKHGSIYSRTQWTLPDSFYLYQRPLFWV